MHPVKHQLKLISKGPGSMDRHEYANILKATIVDAGNLIQLSTTRESQPHSEELNEQLWLVHQFVPSVLINVRKFVCYFWPTTVDGAKLQDMYRKLITQQAAATS